MYTLQKVAYSEHNSDADIEQHPGKNK